MNAIAIGLDHCKNRVRSKLAHVGSNYIATSQNKMKYRNTARTGQTTRKGVNYIMTMKIRVSFNKPEEGCVGQPKYCIYAFSRCLTSPCSISICNKYLRSTCDQPTPGSFLFPPTPNEEEKIPGNEVARVPRVHHTNHQATELSTYRPEFAFRLEFLK